MATPPPVPSFPADDGTIRHVVAWDELTPAQQAGGAELLPGTTFFTFPVQYMCGVQRAVYTLSEKQDAPRPRHATRSIPKRSAVQHKLPSKKR